MQKEQIEYLKHKHDFQAWQGCNSLKENLFIWNYFLNGSEFPGWQMQSYQQLTLADELRCIQSAWQGQAENKGASIRATIYECPSRLKAHQFLLQLLGQFNLPGVVRQKEIEVGDVAFAGREDAVLLFARANCLFVLHNTDRKLVPVSKIASPFDKALYVVPKVSSKRQSALRIRRFKTSVKEAAVGESVPLEIEASGIATDAFSIANHRHRKSVRAVISLMCKFFSSAGEVLLEQGRPVYKAKLKGPQKITVFALDSAQGVERQECELHVK